MSVKDTNKLKINVEQYERIVGTFFNDGVINKGRVAVLYCLAKLMSETYPHDKSIIWMTFQNAIRGKGYPSFETRGRSQAESPFTRQTEV